MAKLTGGFSYSRPLQPQCQLLQAVVSLEIAALDFPNAVGGILQTTNLVTVTSLRGPTSKRVKATENKVKNIALDIPQGRSQRNI